MGSPSVLPPVPWEHPSVDQPRLPQVPWESAPPKSEKSIPSGMPPEAQKTSAGYTYDPKDLGPNPYSDVNMVKTIPRALPVVGGMEGGWGGAALGSAVGVDLQRRFPKIFGQGPQSGAGVAGTIAADTFTQGVLPDAIQKVLNKTGLANIIGSKLMSAFPSVREGASKVMSDQILGRYQYPETGIIESAAANVADNADSLATRIQSGDQAALKESSDTFDGNSIGNKLLSLQKDFESGGNIANQQSYKNIASQALSDVSHVRNWKLATGEPQTIEQLAMNDLVTNGFKDSSGKLDAAGMLDKLGGTKKEIYSEAISPEKLATFKEFLGQLQDQEKENTTGMVVNFSKRHLLWAGAGLASGAIGELTGHEGFGALGLGLGAAAGGMVLTNSMLGRMMADPEMAQLVVKAMKTPINAPEAGLVNQALQTGARMMGIGIHNAINPSVPSSQSSQPQQ